ncbi:RhoGEF domain containing protein [Tritrichomonas foetus]|uniref:RhoGEF domain containing protein n=1 Tax=Tritrichomonas foetus TaxID=1144522 RepID=A0A1J4JNU8_9EUKA|nr:RhoGEF domain containing protein [Tritrichomonas foetus]|eukprot:OHS99197.1 RhoGEF domain containing protein [Tritrichomonas foetus]
MSQLDIPYPQKGEEWESKRSNLISTIISTERQYVQFLYHFIYEYRVSLADVSRQGLIQNIPAETEELFMKIAPIYKMNNSFLSLLENSVQQTQKSSANRENIYSPQSRVGNCFSRYATQFKVYPEYASSFNEGMIALEAQFNKDSRLLPALESCQSNVGVTLLEILKMPMERITRYTLLLHQLLRVTPREHADRADLVSAYIKISPMSSPFRAIVAKEGFNLIRSVNHEFPTMDLVVDDRYLVFREKEINVLLGSTIMSCQVFLFSDSIMISIPAHADPVHIMVCNIKAVPVENITITINEPDNLKKNATTSTNSNTNSNSDQEGLYKDDSASNENSKLIIENVVDFLTDVDSYRLSFASKKRRDAFIAAVNGLRIDFSLDSESDQIKKLAPIWVNENMVTDCMQCGREFNIVSRKKHCEFCRRVCCRKCLCEVTIQDALHSICRSCDDKGLGKELLQHMEVNYRANGVVVSNNKKHDEEEELKKNSVVEEIPQSLFQAA